MDPAAIPQPGSVLSLISKSGVRYEGILYTINFQKSSVALHTVYNFGTEGRGEEQVPPSDRPFQYVDFPASEISHLQVVKSPQEAQGPAWAPAGPGQSQPPVQGAGDPWSQHAQEPAGQAWPADSSALQDLGPMGPPQQQQLPSAPQPQAAGPGPSFPEANAQAAAPHISFGSVMSAPPLAQPPPLPPAPAPPSIAVSKATAPFIGSQPQPGVPTSAPHVAIMPASPAALNSWSVPVSQVQGQALVSQAANSAQAAEAAAGVAAAAAAAVAAGGRGMQGGRRGRGPPGHFPDGRGRGPGRGFRGQGFRGRGRVPMNGEMHGRASQLRPIPREDFDIQGALERFKKDDLAQEAAGRESPHKPDVIRATHEASDGTGDDFFDSISCEAIERLELGEGQSTRMRPSEQRKVDMETFGGSGLPNRRGRGRGRGRGRRGGDRGPNAGRAPV